MTLNAHFTLNFYYYEQRFQKLFYILTVEPICMTFLLYHVTSSDVRKRTVIRRIFGIRGKNRGSFVDERLRALCRRNSAIIIETLQIALV